MVKKIILAKKIFSILNKHYGKLRCPLKYKQAHELCIAVMLSAQCTDKQVNKITPALFANYPTLESFACADMEDLEELVFTSGFYHNKAKNIKAFANMLIDDFNKQLPSTLSELVKLPGIGRKTANVIQSEFFGIADGITVDTHVIRIANLWKFTSSKKPVQIEKDLMQIFPKETWIDFSLFMVFLGRDFCTARKPNCQACPIKKVCPSSV